MGTTNFWNLSPAEQAASAKQGFLIGHPESDYFAVKLPSDHYLNAKGPRSKPYEPIVRLFQHVVKKYAPAGAPEGFRPNVSNLLVPIKFDNALRKIVRVWAKRTNPGTPKKQLEAAVGWYWLDVSPATLPKYCPKWVKPGYAYVLIDGFWVSK